MSQDQNLSRQKSRIDQSRYNPVFELVTTLPVLRELWVMTNLPAGAEIGGDLLPNKV